MTCGTVILAISVAAIGVAWEAEKRAVVPATRMMLALGHLLRRRAYDARPPSGSGDPRPDPRSGRWRSRRAACRAGIGSRGRLRRLVVICQSLGTAAGQDASAVQQPRKWPQP